jgi:ketosteroid isomerase-like protein
MSKVMFPGVRAGIIKDLIALFEKMDVEKALTYFTDDGLYRFGNYPPAIGRQAIREATTSSHLDQIKGIAFDIKAIWENADAVTCEMDIHYTRNDNTVLTLPCTDIFRMEGEKIREMRVYMDASPLFAPASPQQQQAASPSSPGSLTDIAKRAIAAVEANNIEEYVTYFTQDAVYKIGNIPAVIGPQGIREFAAPVMQMFPKVTHDVTSMWELGDTVVWEMYVNYTRHDGKFFKLPCLDIARFEGNKIKEFQAFIDASPAFS